VKSLISANSSYILDFSKISDTKTMQPQNLKITKQQDKIKEYSPLLQPFGFCQVERLSLASPGRRSISKCRKLKIRGLKNKIERN